MLKNITIKIDESEEAKKLDGVCIAIRVDEVVVPIFVDNEDIGNWTKDECIKNLVTLINRGIDIVAERAEIKMVRREKKMITKIRQLEIWWNIANFLERKVNRTIAYWFYAFYDNTKHLEEVMPSIKEIYK